MKIEEQVLTIEQMQHLKDLGVEVKDTAFCWAKWTILTAEYNWDETYRVCFSDEDYESSSPTLTLQEIFDLLPKEVEFDGVRYFFRMLSSKRFLYTNPVNGCVFDAISENVLETAYKMLCWCAEKGYLDKE